MKDLISTEKCYECGRVMEGRKGEYRYTECGLHSVILKDILVFRCTHCTAIVPEIPAVGVLHRVIALRLIRKRNLLTGDELRFLRKLCGYSINEFAAILGSSKSVVSRWEKEGCGSANDRVVRFLVMSKMARELAAQPEPILRNVTIEQLYGEIESMFKLIEGRAHEAERYEISPEEIARLAGVNEEPAELVGAVH
ncbi:MAG: helix-turn-helix domain-containing protein [Terracidiphilus sp.]|jgi:YgiT-type zinc finger domain-containing protein